jgi:hypothetical protein
VTLKLRTLSDPFLQDVAAPHVAVLNVLGVPIQFASNVGWLVQQAQQAFAGLPSLVASNALDSRSAPSVRMIGHDDLPPSRFDEPPPPMLYGDEHAYVSAMTPCDASYVNLSAGRALITVSPALARFPYHVRYELIEFAAYRLAAHRLGAIGMHAACVAKGESSLLLFGGSGAGKSTLVLALMKRGWDLIGEDGMFIRPGCPHTLRGAPNFIHLSADAHANTGDAMAGIEGKLIRRRSGRRKLEIDARELCAAPRVEAPLGDLIFMDSRSTGRLDSPRLLAMERRRTRRRLIALQPFATRQPNWPEALVGLLSRPAYTLQRGDLQGMVALLSHLVGG